MNARTPSPELCRRVLDNFDLLAEAPGGVPKLREMILQLAVRGKLVAQEKKIHHEGHPASLGKLRRASEEHEGKKEGERIEGPYAVPPGWRWIALGDAVDYNYGEKADSQDIPADAWLLDLEDVEKDTSRLVRRVHAGERQSTSTKSRFAAGDVLYGKLRPYLNKVLVADSDGYCTTEIVPMRPGSGVDPAYVVCALKSRDFLNYTAARAYGMKMPRLGTEDAKRAPFPLPPLPEQKRIVARVDELMKRCDELEARQTERNARHTILVSSCLHTLSSPPTADLRPPPTDHWSLITEHFPLLFASPSSVAELRKTILQLAVQGQLGPPTDLLHEHGRQRPVVGDYVRFLNGYAFQSPWFQRQGVRLVRNVNVGHGSLNWEDMACISLERATAFSKWDLKPGDLVLSLDRPIIASGLKAARVKSGDLPCLLLQRVAKAEFVGRGVTPDYFLLWLQSPLFTESIDPGRSKGVPHISTRQVEAIPFSPPPLADQKRIVAKVSDLMALCDALEAKLTQSRTDADTLAAAVVHRLHCLERDG